MRTYARECVLKQNRNANTFTWLLLSWVMAQPLDAQRECRKQEVMMYIQRSLLFIVYCNKTMHCTDMITTVEPLLSGLMSSCRWPDNKKSWIIKDDPKTTC
jgi:hypothetical protein